MKYLLLLILLTSPLSADRGVSHLHGPIPESVSVADNGGGTQASSTLTPGQPGVTLLTILDTDGADITLSEASAFQGQLVRIVNVGSYGADFADQAGVLTLHTSPYTLAASRTMWIVYTGSEWLEAFRDTDTDTSSHDSLSGVSTSDHHVRYADSEAEAAINADVDHGSTATHSHGDLTSVGTSDHHVRYADSEAATAINADVDHGSTATHSHGDLTSVGTSDHHVKPTVGSGLTDTSGTWSVNSIVSAGITDGTIATVDLAFDTATEAELTTHSGLASVHHTKYLDSEAEAAINADADHSSTATHSYADFTGTGVGSSNITNGSIGEIDLNASGTPTTTTSLSYDNFGNFVWVENAVAGSGLTDTTGTWSVDSIVSAGITDGTIVSADIAASTIVTGDILDGTIAKEDLNTSNSPTDEYVLSWEATGSTMVWQADATGGGGGGSPWTGVNKVASDFSTGGGQSSGDPFTFTATLWDVVKVDLTSAVSGDYYAVTIPDGSPGDQIIIIMDIHGSEAQRFVIGTDLTETSWSSQDSYAKFQWLNGTWYTMNQLSSPF